MRKKENKVFNTILFSLRPWLMASTNCNIMIINAIYYTLSSLLFTWLQSSISALLIGVWLSQIRPLLALENRPYHTTLDIRISSQ
jgi:hypothetical protein